MNITAKDPSFIDILVAAWINEAVMSKIIIIFMNVPEDEAIVVGEPRSAVILKRPVMPNFTIKFIITSGVTRVL